MTMASKSCSTLYKSGRGNYASYEEWNKKFMELLNIEHGVNLSREDYDKTYLSDQHYKKASRMIRDRELSPITLYKKVVKNRLKLIEALRTCEDSTETLDINRAIASYDNYLHDKGVPFTMNTALEISIPSGTIVMTDNFVENFVPSGDYEGQSAWMHNLAVGYMNDYKIATARIDETPALLRKNGNEFVIATLGKKGKVFEDEVLAKYNRTGLYDYSIELMDYDNWLNTVGTRLEESHDYSLFHVTPGVYLWTVYSHNQKFYEDYYTENDKPKKRKVYAELTFVREL